MGLVEEKVENNIIFDKLKNEGLECDFVLPYFEDGTSLKSLLVGDSHLPNSAKKFRTNLKLAKKGIDITKGDLNGQDVIIPWERISKIKYYNDIPVIKRKFFIIVLDNYQEIIFDLRDEYKYYTGSYDFQENNYDYFKAEDHENLRNMIFNYINDNLSGEILADG